MILSLDALRTLAVDSRCGLSHWTWTWTWDRTKPTDNQQNSEVIYTKTQKEISSYTRVYLPPLQYQTYTKTHLYTKKTLSCYPPLCSRPISAAARHRMPAESPQSSS